MRFFVFVVFLLSIPLVACSGDESSQCLSGSEGCECSNALCFNGLVCLSNTCVDPDATPMEGDLAPDFTPDSDVVAPMPNTCASNADCDPADVCAWNLDGTSQRCMNLPDTACASSGFCIKDRQVSVGNVGDVEGYDCDTTCNVAGAHLTAVCAEQDNGGGLCVPLCQYQDDPSRYDCITDPTAGIATSCKRDHARIFAALRNMFWCFDSGLLQNAACINQTGQISANLDWTLSCFEDRVDSSTSCISIWLGSNPSSCLLGDNPEAVMSQAQFLDEVEQFLTSLEVDTSAGGGSGGGSDQCSTDCDCGRCGYCESSSSGSVCRYGGEGPYGCYRGCQ